MKIDYKFNEGALIKELQQYIDKTYNGHYSKNKFQSTEFIIDCGHGEGFALGNCLKYVQRYGKKDGKNRNDLLKVLHYALIALHVHDEENETESSDQMEMFKLTTSPGGEDYLYNTSDIVYNTSINKTSIDSATPEEWNEAYKNVTYTFNSEAK